MNNSTCDSGFKLPWIVFTMHHLTHI